MSKTMKTIDLSEPKLTMPMKKFITDQGGGPVYPPPYQEPGQGPNQPGLSMWERIHGRANPMFEAHPEHRIAYDFNEGDDSDQHQIYTMHQDPIKAKAANEFIDQHMKNAAKPEEGNDDLEGHGWQDVGHGPYYVVQHRTGAE